jgi:O-antigen/teichoic acid export membrane protein
MAALTFAEGAARVLSFCFYLIAARVLAPEGFGVVRYTIALSLLALAGVQVLATALNRELGAARGHERRIDEVLGSSLAAALVLFVLFAALSVVAGVTGLTGSASLLGLLVTLGGFAGFQIYYAIARGLGQSTRAVVTYAGGSLAQVVVFGILALTLDPTPVVALLVFGLSSVLPVVAWELYRPVVRGRRLRIRRSTLEHIRRIGGPVALAQVGFLVWISADQIWVENVLGTREIGLYGAAKNLAQVFFVLPAGVTGALLPRMAELRTAGETDRARQLVYRTTVGLVVLSAVLAILVIAMRSTLLSVLYGAPYEAAAASLVGLSLGFVAYAGVAGLTEAALGWGRPGLYTLGMLTAAALQLGYLAAFADDQASTAAWASGISMTASFAVVVLWLCLRPLDRRSAR